MPIGVNGVGPHKHNDWLSFEICVDDLPIIVDPGTYCYTGNIELRRVFRSTAYHNTVVIDGEEQITINDSQFALVKPYGDIKVLNWKSDSESDLLEAEHTGYTILAEPVIHRRQFFLDKKSHSVRIEDSFLGHGKYFLEWHLHLEERLRCSFRDKWIDILVGDETVAYISLSANIRAPQVKKGWVSKSFNQRKETDIIYYNFQLGDKDFSPIFVQQIIPYL